MRLVKQSIERRDGSGTATLVPEEPEDMWHAYNLIRPNDILRAHAIRKVKLDSGNSATTTRITTARKHTVLTIRVKSIDFDIGSSQLHIGGQTISEDQWVKAGQYHTLDLELQRDFTLEKADGWDSVALETLKEATDPTRRAEVWAVVMQDGLANISLITEHQTIFRQRVEISIPRKRKSGVRDHDKGLEKFFSTVLATLLRQIDPATTPLRPLLLASPGFTASAFQNYIRQYALSAKDKQLQSLLPLIIVAHSSSGHMHALHELLRSPAILSKLSDTKYARETALMDRFFGLLRHDDARAWYGPREVESAVEKGAVGRGGGVLLISNALFRSQDVEVRKRWVSLVDRVRDMEGGEVRVLSSLHESGKRLEGLGGIAAILSFPIGDLDEEVRSDGKTEDSHTKIKTT